MGYRWIDDTDEERCRHFDLDPKKVRSLARRLSSLGREASHLGVVIFGGSGSGSLRPSGHHGAQNVLATIDGDFDGGDGGDEFD